MLQLSNQPVSGKAGSAHLARIKAQSSINGSPPHAAAVCERTISESLVQELAASMQTGKQMGRKPFNGMVTYLYLEFTLADLLENLFQLAPLDALSQVAHEKTHLTAIL